MLCRDVLFPAETAADVFILDDNPFRFPAEHDRDFMPRVIDALVG